MDTTSSLPMASRRRALAWPLLLALVVGVAFQGSRGLMETSETRYAECAREMLVTGNWLEPTLEFEPHWTKPPVTYWCMALGMRLCGVNAWGVRLPAVLALLAAVAAVTLTGRRLWSLKAGCIAGLALALGYPGLAANMATTDIYLLGAQAVAGAMFLVAATESSAVRRLALTRGMWALWGICFLIKGPPALLPLVAIVPWNALQPKAKRVPLADVLGLALAAGIGLSWYLLVVARHPELLGYFIGTEIVDRVASDLGHNRAWYKAFEVYVPAMLGVAGVFGLWAAARAWSAGWKHSARWRELWLARDERLLLVGWILLPLLVFSLSTSKLPLYVLPLSVPVALLSGRVLARRTRWRRVRSVALALAALLILIKGAAARWPSDRDMAALAREVKIELQGAPPQAQLVLWDRAKMHGLSFYLELPPDGLPWRVATKTRGPFDDCDVDECARRLREPAHAAGAVIVAARKSNAALGPETLLDKDWIRSVRETEFWRFLRVQAAPDLSMQAAPQAEQAH